MVKLRVACLAVISVLALSVPAVAAAVGPGPDDRGYCPGGQIIEAVEEFGGKALGQELRLYRDETGFTFGEAIRLVCVADAEIS